MKNSNYQPLLVTNNIRTDIHGGWCISAGNVENFTFKLFFNIIMLYVRSLI